MKPCIIVLGMHRSGTSAATGVLALMGADIGATVMTPTHINPKGFFENQRIRELNDRILSALGTSWDGPFADAPGWERSDTLATIHEDALQALAEEFGQGRLIGIKDPRLCLLLPFWEPLLGRLAIAPKFVIAVRHPLEVAASLNAGYGFSMAKGVLLWMQHMLAAEKSTRGRPRLFQSFDRLLDHPREFAERVASDLGVFFSRTWEQAETEVQRFLDPGLKHYAAQGGGPEVELAGEAMECHAILSELADPSAGQSAALQSEPLDRMGSRLQRGLRIFYHKELLALASNGRRWEISQGDRQATADRLASEKSARRRLNERLLDQAERLNDSLADYSRQLSACRRELDTIKGSKVWRSAERLRRLIYGRMPVRRRVEKR